MRAIVIIDNNNGLGVNNTLPFRFKSDMLHFREKTLNNTVVMGRKTFESLPRVLDKRDPIVLSRDYNIKSVPNNAWIIGGSIVYKAFEHLITEFYITHVNGVFQADTFLKNDLSKYQKEVIKEVYDKNLLDNQYYNLLFIRYFKKM